MKFKKINILDCAKPKVYHDRYGWVEQVQIYIVGKVKLVIPYLGYPSVYLSNYLTTKE